VSQADSPADSDTPPRPRFFVDRSLGRIEFPRLLRARGVDLITLAEHYGIPSDESVEDVTWLADTARLGWVVLAKDARLRQRPAERAAIHEHEARCFYFARADLPAAETAARFVRNRAAIERACSDPGPFAYAIHAKRILRMSL
jgi:uncharacterized protein with PIN domain